MTDKEYDKAVREAVEELKSFDSEEWKNCNAPIKMLLAADGLSTMPYAVDDLTLDIVENGIESILENEGSLALLKVLLDFSGETSVKAVSDWIRDEVEFWKREGLLDDN